jgi:hypothetical protein
VNFAGVRTVAFYLPQFYPTAENDHWWRPGYTEWDQVRAAIPLYDGHEQPKVPADLGYYDLRDRSVRQQQANLARQYGVTAFCYWYYWSDGKRLLRWLIDDIIASGQPDLPFMLGWSNATWRDVTENGKGRILLEQSYGGCADSWRHFDWLSTAFDDPRYIRVDGRPALLVYRPTDLPLSVIELWRRRAIDHGYPGLHLIGYQDRQWPATRPGYDAAIYCTVTGRIASAPTGPIRLRYDDLAHELMIEAAVDSRVYPCVISNWDHTPRSGRYGTVVMDSSPERFCLGLRRALSVLKGHPPDGRLLFLKSWNEWSEGNYLEPDAQWGRAYLEVLRDAVRLEQST